MVVAPSIGYVDGLPLIGWREHDRRAPYRVLRLKLLRTVLGPERDGAGLRRPGFLLADIAIRLRLAATLLRLILRGHVRAVCIGELLASGWMLELLRAVSRLLARSGRGIRLIVYVHGEEITTQDPYDPGAARRRRALLAADRIIVVSRFTLGAVRGMLGEAASAKTSLIENGVDTQRFRPGEARPDLAALYRLDGCFVFVSVCRLLEKKGIDHAIRAFARVAAAHPDCRYLVVGTGPFEETLRAIAVESGVAARVVFAGQVADDELAAHYRLGDVFVMPNRELANGDTEGFGLVFLEANSCGLPVIAGRDGGSTDAVRDGENGLVVEGRSIPAIAAAMERLYGDPDLRAALAARGQTITAAGGWGEKAAAFVRLCGVG
jgi:phosphatidylinositol alpha-1,6-mannosyltransferase